MAESSGGSFYHGANIAQSMQLCKIEKKYCAMKIFA
ncbi:hypothetical protein SM11_pD1092 (plasmid) [Sinorhizobium meliloti SM11]|uniref:Uncharacterized protein n=1 Tax=Sinorhizobium meliloti (strain SM11) TaxID=707241 RepID=F7XH98_SINMM|nr:hypothetical protein SM11_pD1092 [Sinorhizobium meliloti SM11]